MRLPLWIPVSALCLAVVAACRAGRTDSAGGRAPGGTAPGVVLFCVDTLRADAVGRDSGGEPAGSVPSLASFAREATDFPGVVSAAAWTAPGVASLLTARIPSGHGVFGAHEAPVLQESVPTLAERFRAAGWSTAGLTAGGWVGEKQGLSRGFDVWREDFDFQGPARIVSEWVSSRPAGRPFFLFLHTYAAHDPYGPKGFAHAGDPARVAGAEAEVRRAIVDLTASEGRPAYAQSAFRSLALSLMSDPYVHDAYTRITPPKVLASIHAQLTPWVEGGWASEPDAPSIAAAWKAAYERGLSHVDRVVSMTLEALRAAGLPEGTIVAITSDHGEAFGEHGFLGHGADLHDEVVRVPLLVKAPGRLAPGVVPGTVGTVDVGPTLLDLAGLPPLDGADGRSLLPLARGERNREPVVSEAERAVFGGEPGQKVRLVSVRTERAAYFAAFDAETGDTREEWAFDLDADPSQSRPLAAEGLGRFGAPFCSAVERVRAGRGAVAPKREVCSAH